MNTHTHPSSFWPIMTRRSEIVQIRQPLFEKDLTLPQFLVESKGEHGHA